MNISIDDNFTGDEVFYRVKSIEHDVVHIEANFKGTHYNINFVCTEYEWSVCKHVVRDRLVEIVELMLSKLNADGL